MNQQENLGIIELSRLFQALSDPTRLQLALLLIDKGPMNVSMISKELKKSQSLISHHLSCLRNCGVLKYSKEGQNVYYEIASKEIKGIILNAIKHVREYGSGILSCELIGNF